MIHYFQFCFHHLNYYYYYFQLTKYGRLPFEEGLNNNQLATATRASKGTRRERCPEDVMTVAPLGCGSINEGIHY